MTQLRPQPISAPNPNIERPIFGFNIKTTVTDEDLDLMASWGVTRVRCDLSWSVVAPDNVTYFWELFDDIMERAYARGIKLCWVLAYANTSAGFATSKTGPATLAQRNAFTTFAVNCITRYVGRDCWWEIWNEPNLTAFWAPTPSATDYAALVTAVSTAVRGTPLIAAEKLLGPGTAQLSGSDPAAPDWTYINAVQSAGALSLFDILTIHPYYQANGPAAQEADIRTLSAYGKPFVLSEWGYSTTPSWQFYEHNYVNSNKDYGTTRTASTGETDFDANAGRILEQQVRMAKRWAPWGLLGVLFYEFQDSGTDGADAEDNFGWVDTDGNLKYEDQVQLSEPKIETVSAEEADFSDLPSTYDYDAEFVSIVVPPGMEGGQTYSISVTFRNTGSTTWTAAGNVRLATENPSDNTTWGHTARVFLAGGDSIATGQTKTFTFNVVAPAAGTYDLQYRMIVEGLSRFGDLSTNQEVTTVATE